MTCAAALGAGLEGASRRIKIGGMPTFSRRRTRLESYEPDPQDYVFLVDGREAGRCYRSLRPGGVRVFHWTVYDRPITGDAPSLEAAQEAFKAAWASA